MSYSLDQVAVFSWPGAIELDKNGNNIETGKVEKEVFCAEKSAGQGEYFKAGQQGIRAELVLVADTLETDGASEVSYQGSVFTIYRTYKHQEDDLTEIYLARKVGR